MSNAARIFLALSASALLLAAGQAARADYISGVTIEDVSSEDLNWGRAATHLVDGSGLEDGAHSSSPDGTMWDALPTDPAPSVTFDLGAAYSVASLHVWNYNAFDFNGIVYRERSVKDLVVSTSLDGVAYTSLGQFTFALAPGVEGYLGETVDLGGVDARYVRFDILSNYSAGGGFDFFGTGLSEIRFTAAATAVPEPAGLAMLGLGAGVLGCVARRKARASA